MEEEKITDNQILFNNLQNPSNKVHCDNCEKNITKHAKIICEDCQIDLCVTCFAEGVEFGNHKSNHPYNVVNKLNFPVFVQDWSAEEELLLFEGLERFGFGNWQEISEHMGSNKTKEEVEDHYEQVYLRETNPNYVPSENILSKRDQSTMKLTVSNKQRSNSEEIQRQARIQKKKPLKQQEKNNNKNQKGSQVPQQSTSNVSEIVGYMPNRGDFDIEYDNDAELLLAEMEFNDDDKQGEIDMKLKILDIYNARLDERVKRKKFVIERGLLDIKKQNNTDKERTKDEKEIYNMMKVFSRFQTAEEHEKLVQGIIKEKQIRQRIEELRTYRKLGLKTFEEVEKHLQEKKKKDETYQKRIKQHENVIYEKTTGGAQNRGSAQSRRTRSLNQYADDAMSKDGIDKRKIPQNMNEQEMELCDKLGMSPYEYIVIKEVLVREGVKENFIKKDFAENTLKLDKERLTGIFDFLVTHNYIMERQN